MAEADDKIMGKYFGGRTITSSSVFWFLGLFMLAGLDQYTKLIFPPFRNYGFAFGISLPPWLIYSIYATVVIVLASYFFRHRKGFSFFQNVGWLLICAGSICNIFERIFFGYVRDFIYLPGGSVINFADIYITVGLIILLFFRTGLSKS